MKIIITERQNKLLSENLITSLRRRGVLNYDDMIDNINLHENINRIQEMMGIIPENKNSSISKMVDLLGVNDTIRYIGGIDKFNTMGGMDYLFNKVDELLKNYNILYHIIYNYLHLVSQYLNQIQDSQKIIMKIRLHIIFQYMVI